MRESLPMQLTKWNYREELMTKNKLVEIMANTADISKNAATRALDAFTNSVTKSLREGEDVVLVGFGAFKTSQRVARMGRNPRTGEPMKIPAIKVVRFSAGKKLKEALNGE